jgi:hypothetical protein
MESRKEGEGDGKPHSEDSLPMPDKRSDPGQRPGCDRLLPRPDLRIAPAASLADARLSRPAKNKGAVKNAE